MAEKVEKYKYKFDEDRSDLLIDLYRVKRKAEKIRNNCENDERINFENRVSDDFYSNEWDNIDILISGLNNLIHDFDERCHSVDKNPTKKPTKK